MDWTSAAEAFLNKLRGDNCTPATLETYRYLLIGGRARKFLAEHDIGSAPQLDKEVLEALKGEFLAAGLKAATVDDYVRVWRTFARFCIDRGWGVDERTLSVKGPRQPKLLPKTFTADEEARLIAACRSERDRLIIRLTLETGLRLSEVANLTIDDIIEVDTGWLIRVRQGKGRKDRGVPLGRELAADLERLIGIRPRTQCRALFLTHNRVASGDFGGLRPNGIYQTWRRLGQATGINAHPHKGRHTAATRWAQEGLYPWAIQRALGHTTLAMTNRYVDSSAIDLIDAFKRRRVR